MRPLRLAAAVSAALAVLLGPASIVLAGGQGERERGPFLIVLGSTFALSAVVVVIRAMLRRRLGEVKHAPPPPKWAALVTLLATPAAWALLVAGAFAGQGAGCGVLYAADDVPWGRLGLLWLIVVGGVTAPAAWWCWSAAKILESHESPTRF